MSQAAYFLIAYSLFLISCFISHPVYKQTQLHIKRVVVYCSELLSQNFSTNHSAHGNIRGLVDFWVVSNIAAHR